MQRRTSRLAGSFNFSAAPPTTDFPTLRPERRSETHEFKDHPTFQHEKRWVREPGWCLLCREPFASWGAHVSLSRSNAHRILEMLHDVIVTSSERRWSVHEMIRSACALHASLPQHMHTVWRSTDSTARNAVIAALRVLERRGVFRQTFLTDKGMGNLALVKGSNIIPVHLMRLLLVLFSQFDTGYLSGIIEHIVEWQNVEAAYTILECKSLFENTPRHGNMPDGDAFKAMIGELYYAATVRPGRPRLSSDTRALAHFAFLGSLAELLVLKMAQWVRRVDSVWRTDYGAAAKNPTLSQTHALNHAAESPALAFPVAARQLTQLVAHRFHPAWATGFEQKLCPAQRVASAELEFGERIAAGNMAVHTPNSYRPRFPALFHVD